MNNMTKNLKIFYKFKKSFLILSIIIVFSVLFGSESKASSVENGKGIFEHICSRCHTLGGGLKVGPDLKGVTDKREKKWLFNWISNPEKVVESGDAIAEELLLKYTIKMPSHGLSTDEISSLITYLESQKLAPAVPIKEEKKEFEINLVSNTYFLYSENVEGKKFAPLYEYVEMDVKDNKRRLSFHSAGWLGYDLSTVKADGERERDEFTYAYLSYRPIEDRILIFNLGRHLIFGGVASEQIDGASARWEIIPSTGISLYGGVPVETEDDKRKSDSIYGGRIFQKIERRAEIGISYLKENNDSESYREEMGIDVWGFPLQWLELQGQSFYNNITDGWIEHSYNLRLYPIKRLVVSAFVSHTDYNDAFSATTISAFSPDYFGIDERMTKIGGSADYEFWNKAVLTGDYTNYDYKLQGSADYFGASISATRYSLKTGVSLHRMNGSSDRLKYWEARGYAVKSFAGLKAALDAINIHYDRTINDLSNAYSINGTISYGFTRYLSAMLNLDYGKNPDFTHEFKGLFKLVLGLNK
ncbi:MAG: cytochrome c [Nitrospirae bacterium]|nr:cytochrome c [Nitrospirota bacterium]